jgi:YHS domain-containing protein
MVRYVLVLALVIIVARAFWRILDGVVQGLRGPAAPRPPARAVPMERDPVCGTFIVRDSAVTLAIGGRQVYFCSTGCRDKYRAA